MRASTQESAWPGKRRHRVIATPGLCGLCPAILPLAEHHRIVAKFDKLMALCDRLEARLTAGETTPPPARRAAARGADAHCHAEQRTKSEIDRHYYTFAYGDTTFTGTPFVRAIYEEPRAYFASATIDF